ncbi:MAG: zinc ribbon domain-containing protein [Lentisphaerae bacterium]|nr:zinc ribbon domain-containing protein [Lentisphaerota bacterium]MBQ9804446.1 zinc ribbon domain-containing protein [Lentisphaeria bacterium]
MPLFSYRCNECDAEFELLLARFDSPAECPKCGATDLVRNPSRIGAISSGSSCAMKSSCPAAGGCCCGGACAGKH